MKPGTLEVPFFLGGGVCILNSGRRPVRFVDGAHRMGLIGRSHPEVHMAWAPRVVFKSRSLGLLQCATFKLHRLLEEISYHTDWALISRAELEGSRLSVPRVRQAGTNNVCWMKELSGPPKLKTLYSMTDF